MGKMIGILVVTLAIWAGMEVMNNGVSGAFGGLLAGAEARPVAEHQTIPQRAGNAVQDAHAAGEERRARLLGE